MKTYAVKAIKNPCGYIGGWYNWGGAGDMRTPMGWNEICQKGTDINSAHYILTKQHRTNPSIGGCNCVFEVVEIESIE